MSDVSAPRRGAPALPHRLLWGLVLAVAAVALALGAFRIGLFVHIRGELDPSWMAAIGEAPARGDVFGRDIIFTGGPLSAAYTRYFSPVTWWWVMLWSGAAVLLFVLSLLAFRPGPVAALAFAVAFFTANVDAAFVALPLLAALPAMKGHRFARPVLVFGAAVSAAAVLAKFSVMPIAVAAFALADAVALRRRQVPWGLLAFAASFTALLSLLNGGPAATVDYVLASFEAAAGYVAAMSIPGPRWEIAAYLALALLLFALIAGLEFFRRGRPGVAPVAAVLTLLAYVFLTFKSGFIRHDFHSLTAWSALSIAAALYLCASRAPGRPLLRGGIFAVTVAAPAALFTIFAVGVGAPVGAVVRNELDDITWSARSLLALAEDPAGWLAARMAEREAARAEVRTQFPLPALSGTVDTISSNQGRVIANGLDYRPRYTVQEYTTFTPRLIAANRAFFRSTRAPDHLFFAPETLDYRHPAASEGALWPDLLRIYAPGEVSGDLLVMHRRARPVGNLLGKPVNKRAGFSQSVELGVRRAFVRIRIEPTLIGRLVGAAWRPPLVRLRVRYTDGSKESFRLIPGQAEAGFVLSPRIASVRDFLAFWAGADKSAALPVVRSISVQTSGLARLAYRDDVGFSIQEIKLKPLIKADRNNPLQVNARNRAGRLKLLTANLTINPPYLDLADEGVFAHAPSRIETPASGARLRLGFGIRPSAGSENADGVCFRVSVKDGATLWERCLDPHRNPADAGPQAAEVAIPPGAGALVFETDCRAECSYDWSYWSEASLLKR